MKAIIKGMKCFGGATVDAEIEANDIQIVEEEKKEFSAKDENEALRLYHEEKLAPVCPECGNTGFPTNFPASSVGGEKDDKRTVWFCKDMGHCAFPVTPKTKWIKRLS